MNRPSLYSEQACMFHEQAERVLRTGLHVSWSNQIPDFSALIFHDILYQRGRSVCRRLNLLSLPLDKRFLMLHICRKLNLKNTPCECILHTQNRFFSEVNSWSPPVPSDETVALRPRHCPQRAATALPGHLRRTPGYRHPWKLGGTGDGLDSAHKRKGTCRYLSLHCVRRKRSERSGCLCWKTWCRLLHWMSARHTSVVR